MISNEQICRVIEEGNTIVIRPHPSNPKRGQLLICRDMSALVIGMVIDHFDKMPCNQPNPTIEHAASRGAPEVEDRSPLDALDVAIRLKNMYDGERN